MRAYVFIKHGGFNDYGDYGNKAPNVLIKAYNNGGVINVSEQDDVVAFVGIRGQIASLSSLYRNFPRLFSLYLKDKLEDYIMLDIEIRHDTIESPLDINGKLIYSENKLDVIRDKVHDATDILLRIKQIAVSNIAMYVSFQLNSDDVMSCYYLTRNVVLNNRIPSTFKGAVKLCICRYVTDEESERTENPIEAYVRKFSMCTFPMYYTLKEASYSCTNEVLSTLTNIAYALNIPKTEWGNHTVAELSNYNGGSADELD